MLIPLLLHLSRSIIHYFLHENLFTSFSAIGGQKCHFHLSVTHCLIFFLSFYFTIFLYYSCCHKLPFDILCVWIIVYRVVFLVFDHLFCNYIMNFLRALDTSERLHLCQGILNDGFQIVIVTGVGVGTVWFWFTPFRAWYNLTHFPEMTKPLLVHKVCSDVGVCFLFQIFFFFCNWSHSVSQLLPLHQLPAISPAPQKTEWRPINPWLASDDLTNHACLLSLTGTPITAKEWRHTAWPGQGGQASMDSSWTPISQELSKPHLCLTPGFQGCESGRGSF